MEWTAIVVAIISAAVSLIGLRGARRTESRRAHDERALAALEFEFKRQERLESRSEDLAARLDAQREPLIEAVDDLARRIENIRHGGFLEAYVEDGDVRRRELAVLSTLYRLGKYFAAVEMVRRGTDARALEQHPATKGLSEAMAQVSRVLATDEFRELMVWREEQRAMGELLVSPASRRPIGFAEFVNRYDADFQRWFALVHDELVRPGIAESPRLELLQEELRELEAVLLAGRRPDVTATGVEGSLA